MEGELKAGCCVRIMTGAPIPQGVDTVVMQESTQQTDQGIVFTQPIKQGSNIRKAGKISPRQCRIPCGHLTNDRSATFNCFTGYC